MWNFCSVVADCIICMEDIKWPVFCPQCKKGTCYDCLQKWHGTSRICPHCRCLPSNILTPDQKNIYACMKDGRLIEYYCEQCLQCFCRECTGIEGQHFRHPIRSLHVLLTDILQSMQLLKIAGASETVDRIYALAPQGHPKNLVGQIIPIRKILEPETLNNARGFEMQNMSFFKYRFYLRSFFNTVVPECIQASDTNGNQWQCIVFPNGNSDARQKFVSLYLKLLKGTALRYEYKFTIYNSVTNEVLAEYYAIDDFSEGSKSLACQRLISIDEARAKALDYSGNRVHLSFEVRPTDAMYGLRCAASLASNKQKKLEYKDFTFVLTDFDEKKISNRIVFSDVVYDQQNIAWRIRIDCNGHQEQGEYLSAYLELLNGAMGWFDIYIELMHPKDESRSFQRRLTHEFSVHSNWGIPHFIALSSVRDFLDVNTLKFQYGMRPARLNQEM